ncbi:type I-C CRISPR-associated protein Cas5 [Oscillatoria sp. FACHB-1407]|uniref:type I-C CRISPR-associated protein Cas5c n=1 Tax=Oscillatoria sp. FACHB-1407 TaxID=2692847 RepID=UPI001687A9E9|nr:type I-C CRISPR-associated protein Cas5c [Oscillatoria sp. FACHB-1407]MBD2462271.1 type I-C CRISPR-associated protein Cas5 [Oscillatoria sp. FACHB-1407]
MSNDSLLSLRVRGDFALFTRPEFSAERVTYDVPTPSAMRGVLEAVFFKPEICWVVHEIHVLNSIRYFSLLRNEVNSHQNERTARTWENSGTGGYYADEDRSQRHALCLRNVDYLIKAEIRLKPHADAHPAKYRDQFRRRVARGQCYYQPYLGTREFSAFFSEPDGTETPIDDSRDLGLMLFDMEITEATDGSMLYLSHSVNGARVTKGNAQPKFFPAQLQQGILKVPTQLYQRGEVLCS